MWCVVLAVVARHCDNADKNGRKATAILYLNPGWVPEDGGCLRVYQPDGVTHRLCGQLARTLL